MKDILFAFGLLWCIPSSFILLQEVHKLWQEVHYLIDILEEKE